jgi:hypothetical protein
MEDELIKNSTQIWKKLRSEGGMLEKLRSITGEILVIVFAVSFSIWINNRAEYRKEQEEVLDFLLICQEELSGDTADLKRIKGQVESIIRTNQILIGLDEKMLDSIKKNNLDVSFDGTPIIRRTHIAGYEGFKTSGRLGNIENKKLKEMIMKYYEVHMPSLREGEDYYNANTNLFVDRMIDRVSDKGKEAFLEKNMKKRLAMNLNIAGSMVPNYQGLLDFVGEFQSELNKEISAKQEGSWF